MPLATAKDIMIPLDKYPHIPYWFTLRQAITSMEKAHIEIDGQQSLPRIVLVFDETYQLMGILRRRDILQGLGRNALQDKTERPGETDPNLVRDRSKTNPSESQLVKRLQERSTRPVNEVMTPIRITVPASMSITDLIDFMAVNDTAVLPVEDDNSIIGIVNSTTVLHYVGKLLE